MKLVRMICIYVCLAGCLLMTISGTSIASSLDLSFIRGDGVANTNYPAGHFIVEPDSRAVELAKKIQGEADFEKVRDLDSRDNDFGLARQVGYFSIGGGSCSGFLVGPDLFLSNHHCVYDEVYSRMRPVEHYEIFMDYLDENNKGQVTSKVKEVLVKNEYLDFALLRLEKPLGARLGWLQLGGEVKANNDGVKIFQHPQGRSKEVSRKHSKIVKETNTVLHYMADTEGGSSGSPVFSRDGTTVIALHHVGSNTYNEGVLMERILPHIEQWLWFGRTSPQASAGNRPSTTGEPSESPSEDMTDQMLQQTIQNLFK